ncbi:MAG: hypothetical protein SGBAC_003134 [Bacillariaceae sp.]
MQQKSRTIVSSTQVGAEEEPLDLLPEGFVPGKWDVICQRGKECFDHVGNRRFRMIIDSHLSTYMEVMSRRQKTRIVSTIVKNITVAAASGGGFVRKDLLTRRWYKVNEKLAREKVGQALRDAIKTKKSSGSQSKSAKRNSKKSLATQGVPSMIDGQCVQMPLSTSQLHGILGLNTASTTTPTKALNTPAPNAVPSHCPPNQNQMVVADLEPTPLRAQSMSLPGLFDRSCMAHERSESSASTLLRLFDEKSACGDVMEAVAVHAAAAAATQSRRLSLSQMTFHPITDTSLLSAKNDFEFF